MNFFLPMQKIPTCTAQQQKVAIVKGKPRFYKDGRLKATKQLFIAHLAPHAPKKPFIGAIKLTVIWLFPTTDKKKHHQHKTTRPDTDNMLKLFKDVMTECGYWQDDAQVSSEFTEKRWTCETSGIFVEVAKMEKENGVVKAVKGWKS